MEKVRNNWKRKIEIAEVASKKARKLLKENQYLLNDVDLAEMDF